MSFPNTMYLPLLVRDLLVTWVRPAPMPHSPALAAVHTGVAPRASGGRGQA